MNLSGQALHVGLLRCKTGAETARVCEEWLQRRMIEGGSKADAGNQAGTYFKLGGGAWPGEVSVPLTMVREGRMHVHFCRTIDGIILLSRRPP
jgi:hypothetical protein